MRFPLVASWLLALTVVGCSLASRTDKVSAESSVSVVPVSAPASVSASSSTAAAAVSASASAAGSAANSVPTGKAFPKAPDPSLQEGARIYSVRRHVWINYGPDTGSGWMGFLGLGDSVKLKGTPPKAGGNCREFYEVEPRGWVCNNERTTLDPKNADYVAIRRFAAKLTDPYPYNYGESHGSPRYFKIPTKAEQRQKEAALDEHLQTLEDLRAGKYEGKAIPKAFKGVDIKAAGHGVPEEWTSLPVHLSEDRQAMKLGSTVSWSEEFDAEGRTWLITGDLALVPKDKVAVYPKVDFHGILLDENVKLPVAFMRERNRPKYEKKSDGSVVATGSQWDRLSWVQLTDEEVEKDKVRYYVTKENGLLLARDDASVARLSPQTPWGTDVEGVSEADRKRESVPRWPAPEGGRRTWAEVSILGGWMVAYEDKKAVFATLISPGKGGMPTPGVDVLKTASTPTGTYRIDGKFFLSTMANDAFVHSDVPFPQNFHGPHAIHEAYWHNIWGELKSGGCINLAPIDALYFFHWTEPLIPLGWHGVRSDSLAGPATVVIVHR